MQFTINLPERTEHLAMIRQRWDDVYESPYWRGVEGRIETNAFGKVIVNPPPGFGHGRREYQIAKQLEDLLGGIVATECPVLTIDGIKGADVGWYDDASAKKVRGQVVPELPPVICVEVLSPGNTPSEMETKRQLYFDAGATECWQCDLDGHMTYYTADAPNDSKTASPMCPEFPETIKE